MLKRIIIKKSWTTFLDIKTFYTLYKLQKFNKMFQCCKKPEKLKVRKLIMMRKKTFLHIFNHFHVTSGLLQVNITERKAKQKNEHITCLLNLSLFSLTLALLLHFNPLSLSSLCTALYCVNHNEIYWNQIYTTMLTLYNCIDTDRYF